MRKVSSRPPGTWRNTSAWRLPLLAVSPAAEVSGRPVRPMGKARMGLRVTCQPSSNCKKETESSPIYPLSAMVNATAKWSLATR